VSSSSSIYVSSSALRKILPLDALSSLLTADEVSQSARSPAGKTLADGVGLHSLARPGQHLPNYSLSPSQTFLRIPNAAVGSRKCQAAADAVGAPLQHTR
jgi:hypothetical protein